VHQYVFIAIMLCLTNPERMMNTEPASIFLIDGDGDLTELKPTEYSSERVLQEVLAQHPILLGSAGSGGSGLLLVRREYGVPENGEGSLRWSLDHLFIDRKGVPVLVEVKRAEDTRSRREVVAQMLDYAANGVAYWPVERIVQAFAETARSRGEEPDLVLTTFLDGTSHEAFWQTVEANLRAGRVRMVFVADRIPAELRRIVEFLNEQMRPAEVLAIELEQFAHPGGVRTLVPRLIGRTQRAQDTKAVRERANPIGEEEWLASLEASKGTTCRLSAEALLTWFRVNGFQVGISDSQDSMFAAVEKAPGKMFWPFFLRRSTGRAETSLQYLRHASSFASDAARANLLDRLRALPDVEINTQKLTGWPSIRLEDFARKDVLKGFQQIALDTRTQILSG
jgi:hypothetical protein